MKLPGTFRPNAIRLNRGSSAFTVVEMLIAMGIAGVVVGAMMTFVVVAARSTVSVSKQAQANDKAGQFAVFLTGRVRDSNFMTNNSAGTEMLLAYDDDVTTDSNKDGDPYNDRDHYEKIFLVDKDGRSSTLNDNSIYYQPSTNKTATSPLIDGGVRTLPGTKLFAMDSHPPGETNGYRRAIFNIGVLYEEGENRTQTVEVKTSAFRRN